MDKEIIKSVTRCTTCGAECEIGGEGETRFYIPKVDRAKAVEFLEWTNKQGFRKSYVNDLEWINSEGVRANISELYDLFEKETKTKNK